MILLKNFGTRTWAIIISLAALFFFLLYLWKERLLPFELFALFNTGCLLFIVLNIIDRKNQLKKLGDTLLAKGEERYKKGEVKGAIRDFEKVLELKGSNYRAYIGLSQSYRGMNEYKRCMEYAKKALEMKSDSAYALFLIGISMFRQEYPDAAIKNLENALQISPDLAEACFMLGEINTSLGHKEEAIRHYTKYLDQCKDDKTIKVLKEKIAKLSGALKGDAEPSAE